MPLLQFAFPRPSFFQNFLFRVCVFAVCDVALLSPCTCRAQNGFFKTLFWELADALPENCLCRFQGAWRDKRSLKSRCKHRFVIVRSPRRCDKTCHRSLRKRQKQFHRNPFFQNCRRGFAWHRASQNAPRRSFENRNAAISQMCTSRPAKLRHVIPAFFETWYRRCLNVPGFRPGRRQHIRSHWRSSSCSVRGSSPGAIIHRMIAAPPRPLAMCCSSRTPHPMMKV